VPHFVNDDSTWLTLLPSALSLAIHCCVCVAECGHVREDMSVVSWWRHCADSELRGAQALCWHVVLSAHQSPLRSQQLYYDTSSSSVGSRRLLSVTDRQTDRHTVSNTWL